MSDTSPTPLTLQEAHSLLKQFDCLHPDSSSDSLERERLRQALLFVTSRSDYQMLGICAETFAQGQYALKTYADALGYSCDFPLKPIDGPVYIKFNPKSGSCYVTSYDGNHRGVLVSCQSTYEAGINEMYGHLPLDLFATK